MHYLSFNELELIAKHATASIDVVIRFPLAIVVVTSKNYVRLVLVLEHLKKVIGDRDFVIIFDRHHILLCNILKLFGVENYLHY